MKIAIITGSLQLDLPREMVVNRHDFLHQDLGEFRHAMPHEIDYWSMIDGLKAREVTHIIAIHTVGGIALPLEEGDMVIPSDFIDYTYGRQLGKTHTDCSHLVDVEMAEKVFYCLREKDQETPIVFGGVMGVTQGPRLETPAEVERLARDGCTVVGMTAMPEALFAKEAGLSYISVALVVNKAAGLSTTPLTDEAISITRSGFKGKIEAAMMSLLKTLHQGSLNGNPNDI